nr:Chain D, Lethal(3)malignant brain tumor-like protein 3 [Homo sapiens]
KKATATTWMVPTA